MNRQEFHQLMANAKLESGISTSAISFELKMLLPTLRRFEKGTNNSNMKKIFDYLRVIGFYLLLNNTEKLHNYDELLAWMIAYREKKFSQRKLAEKINTAYLTIANIERKATVMSIDTFLKIAEALECEIKIEKCS